MPNGSSAYATALASAAQSRSVVAANDGRIFEPYTIVDELTLRGDEAVNEWHDLGPVGMNGLIQPELVRLRYITTATANFAWKLARVAADGTVTDITAAVTMDNSGPEVATAVAATTAPLLPLVPTDRLRLIFTAVTTRTAGHRIGIEIPFLKRQLAPS